MMAMDSMNVPRIRTASIINKRAMVALSVALVMALTTSCGTCSTVRIQPNTEAAAMTMRMDPLISVVSRRRAKILENVSLR
ncbi:hypothetical protein D3C87_1758070 [compost metagenome]